MFERRKRAFEEWFSSYGVLTSQSKYTLALSETQDKLAYYASNPIGGGAQNINISVYPEHSVYEFDDPIRLRNLFDDCTKQNVRDDGAMHTAVGWYAMWLRLKAPDQWKDVEEWPNDNERKKTMKNRGYDYDAVLGQLLSPNGHSANTHIDSAYLAAIRTKPFILLAGISGTGKSRLVRQLARGCCPEKDASGNVHPLCNERKPGNFEMIQVRPNWHDSTQLMGYESRVSGKAEFIVKPFVKFLAKAWLYEEEGVPFFLCLDEMNLAPVEQYFAEYLSVIETRKSVDGKIVTDPLVTFPNETLRDQMLNELYAEKAGEASKIIEMFKNQGGIPIPQNFIVMGTVNMDETTFSFSRKVLDRAMSFELNEVDMGGGLEADPDCKFGSIGMAAAKCEFTQGFEVYAVAKDACDAIKAFLVEVNKVLDKTPFKIAYRTRNEIMIYCHERAKGGVPLAQALDEATSMKILSRVEGDKRRLVVRDEELPEYNGKPLLDSLLDVILKDLKTVRGGDGDYTESDVCSRKLKEMMSQLENGYTSFWTR